MHAHFANESLCCSKQQDKAKERRNARTCIMVAKSGWLRRTNSFKLSPRSVMIIGGSTLPASGPSLMLVTVSTIAWHAGIAGCSAAHVIASRSRSNAVGEE